MKLQYNSIEDCFKINLTFIIEGGLLDPVRLDLGGALLPAQESRLGLALADLRHAISVHVHLAQAAS